MDPVAMESSGKTCGCSFLDFSLIFDRPGIVNLLKNSSMSELWEFLCKIGFLI